MFLDLWSNVLVVQIAFILKIHRFLRQTELSGLYELSNELLNLHESHRLHGF